MKLNNLNFNLVHVLLLTLCTLAPTGNGQSSRITNPETKKLQSSLPSQNTNDGVAVYTNELYSPSLPRSRSKLNSTRHAASQSGSFEDGDDDDEPVYDDYNADYNIPPTFTNFRNKLLSQFQETREILVKEGRVKGVVRIMHPQSGLKNVDQFLGLPYAEAPVGSRRFMPPGAPVPWQGVKLANKFASVCPQKLPDINNPDNTMSKGRYDQLKRLLPYLRNESEDCLYLNLYVPSPDGVYSSTKYPVIVYIHGESYEWNSGNPYDGSILASYGNVIVVTINFRLGILGFFKPGLSDHTVSNFGILDQIAALQWVKENIEAFNGDKDSVTLMGHGHGAACVNFLMVSPVAKGLFHRAILMSGSAVSDWALSTHVLSTTVQVAEALNCPLVDENEEFLKCLRKRRVSDLLGVKVSLPEFAAQFAPIIDGLVVPNVVHKVMDQYSDIFSRYDLMYGVTELESYHLLNAVSLTYGILANDRDSILRTYMQNRFEMQPDLALAATLKEYTELYMDSSNKAAAEEHRDTLLEILSDARVTAPLVQTGLYHSKVNPRCFMYVFSHNSEAGEYARISQSVIGEDLPYVFGAPLGQLGPFQPHYNQQERLFSEAIMKYWTNFAKHGNPKVPWREKFLNMNPPDWQYYDVDWPAFNPVNQSYLHLGITPIVSHRYRYKYMRFWNQELPMEMAKQLSRATMTGKPTIETTKLPQPRRTTSLDMITARMNMYPGTKSPQSYDPIRELHRKLNNLPMQEIGPDPTPGMMNSPHDSSPPLRKYDLVSPQLPLVPPQLPPHLPSNEGQQPQLPPTTLNILQSESTLTLLIGIVLLFLIFNVFVIIGYVVKRNMTRRKLSHKYEDNIFDAMSDEKRSKYNETDDSYIMDIVRRNGNNTYEAIKTSRMPNGKTYILTRQLSSSTVDAHTKVTDWISQDMTTYSSLESKLNNEEPAEMKPGKVNVAVDATPSGRGGSVLRQEPIEITKAKKDYGFLKDIIICQEVDTPVLESAPVRFETDEDEGGAVAVNHKHSNSDPAPITYPYFEQHEEVTSFIEPDDINVTSRDDSIEREPLSPEESLRGIQRRNFPKVLPDYPNQIEPSYCSTSYKRRSLPPQYFTTYATLNRHDFYRLPPAPPPRISSTLGRRPSNTLTSTFLSSPVKMAEEPPSPIEPPIAVNTLLVGPLISRQNSTHHVGQSVVASEPVYLSMKRMNSIEESSTPSTSSNSIEVENQEVPESVDKEPLSSFRSKERTPPVAVLQRQLSSNSDSSTASSTGTVKKVKN